MVVEPVKRDTSADRHKVYTMTCGSFTEVRHEVSPTLYARDYKNPPLVGQDQPAYSMDRTCFDSGMGAHYTMHVHEEESSTLLAKGPNAVAASPEYLVRRLTPQECTRLQGYPDGWCEHLESPVPSYEEIDKWMRIFKEWRMATGGSGKPKTRGNIIRWLQHPYRDGAAYKALGNSVAVPCVHFVLAGIVWAAESETVKNEKEVVLDE